MNTRQYSCETRIVSGLGVVSKIPEELERYDITQPALVVDSDIAKAGLLEKWLTKELLGIPTRIFAPVNPSIKDVESGVDDAKADDCDGVVIIGGGSTMCLGKAIAVMLTNEGQILDYEGNNRLKSPPAPTICVPTTAGSGSEVSKVLVLHERGRRQEVIIRQCGAEPRVALLDGNLLIDCPRKHMIDAALDAISHSCESLWSRNRNLFTDALAEKALETFVDQLPAAINDRNPIALQAILEASSAASLACGNTGLALIHALNTAPDVPLPHGYTNGCLLLAVYAFNRSHMERRHQTLIDRLPSMLEKIGWNSRFKQDEVDPERAELFVQASRDHPFRNNNIRPSSDEECYGLLKESGARIEAVVV